MITIHNYNYITPLCFDEYENCSLELREEHRLSVFENKVLKRIFGSNRDKVTGTWRKLYNEEPYNLEALLFAKCY
jgi:hypothetical protein